ncbi:hypothetical protein KDH_76920 [Dictyobacter sp. S3.2.2.5]|uniref:RDD domain-containing protein n=1 Tax=Dictyobacter halimunensis TaxID=3026934 RepID=A0ABQ6G4V4_9CHLR|nr:hypothetical protein KDH_76920 [Dictyobacter sp. S3.2.2.5]
MQTRRADLEVTDGARGEARSSVVLLRLAAAFLDFLCLSVLGWIVNATFGVTRVVGGALPPPGYNGWTSYSTATLVDWWWLALMAFGYFFVQEALFSTTLGKAQRLYVVPDAAERTGIWRITPWQALLRNLLRPLEVLSLFYALGVGFLTLVCIAQTKKHQRPGDMLARTLVVDKKFLPGELYRASQHWLRSAILVVILACCLVGCGFFYYYGRPPLVIEGLYNTHQLLGTSVQSYQLGAPTRRADTITYPVHFRALEQGKMRTCDGLITLRWYGFGQGWVQSGSQYHWNP